MKNKTIEILKNEITMVDPNDMGEVYPYIPADDEDVEKIATKIHTLYTEPVSDDQIKQTNSDYNDPHGALKNALDKANQQQRQVKQINTEPVSEGEIKKVIDGVVETSPNFHNYPGERIDSPQRIELSCPYCDKLTRYNERSTIRAMERIEHSEFCIWLIAKNLSFKEKN